MVSDTVKGRCRTVIELCRSMGTVSDRAVSDRVRELVVSDSHRAVSLGRHCQSGVGHS